MEQNSQFYQKIARIRDVKKLKAIPLPLETMK